MIISHERTILNDAKHPVEINEIGLLSATIELVANKHTISLKLGLKMFIN